MQQNLQSMQRNMISEKDINFMSLAIQIAKRNIGITSPNPSVGCVITKDNTIISTGVTADGGRPHAEEIALLAAAKKAIGATLYVSLEPCCHQGKINHCTDLIIKSQIKKVVIATIDPDQRTSNLGIEKLKKAGITVELGILEERAREVNKGFFAAKKINRPFITLKLATSLDGKIALKNFDSKWITNEKSREYGHYLRAKNDAILIGANTVKKDNPMLNCRIAGLENFSPKRIIISNKLDIDLNSQIIKTAKNIPTYIATLQSNDGKLQKFLDCGVKIILCKEKSPGKINLTDLLNKICFEGINNLLIEGGSVVATEFLQQNLVDQIIWIKSNFVIGNDGTSAIGNLDLHSLTQIDSKNLRFTRVDSSEIGSDMVTIYNNQKNIDLIIKTAH